MLRFYRDGLGLDVIGEFQGHAGFDGVMLAPPDAQYHLEFTVESGVTAPRAPGEENLLVLYLPGSDDFDAAVSAMDDAGFSPVVSHNPYWDRHGFTYEDADGYRVVLANIAWD